jgi:hypothetical protein
MSFDYTTKTQISGMTINKADKRTTKLMKLVLSNKPVHRKRQNIIHKCYSRLGIIISMSGDESISSQSNTFSFGIISAIGSYLSNLLLSPTEAMR